MAEEYGRSFNAARRAQGFRSQEHLDAFYAAYDHTKSCPECQKFGPGVWVVDEFYPTYNRCAEGQRLDRISFSFH